MFKHVFAAALLCVALFCASPNPAWASGLHPACNVSMPCEGMSIFPPYRLVKKIDIAHPIILASRKYKNLAGKTPSEGIAPSHGLVARARSYLGQTARQVGVRSTLWCSAFLRHITGASGVDDRAISWLRRPHVPGSIGAIAVVRRGRSAKNGHVGLVSGFTATGDPILISGNHGGRVGEGAYPARLVVAYVSL